MQSTPEYDAFGPWIYEIRRPEEVPRLFRSHPLDLDHALLTVKVPREIERRFANASMDLYDHLLSLGPDSITVLSRRGREFDARTVAYGGIQGITEFLDLLDARVTLHVEDAPVVVRYNASSTDVMSQLVDLVRQRYTVAAGEERRQNRPGPLPDVEKPLQSYFRRISAEEGVGRTVAVQRRHAVQPVDASAVGRALARAWPTTLQDVILTVGAREVQVFHRGRPYSTGFKPVQSLARTLLPLERVRGVEVRAGKLHADVSRLVIHVGNVGHEIELDTPVANKAAAAITQALRP